LLVFAFIVIVLDKIRELIFTHFNLIFEKMMIEFQFNLKVVD